MTDIIVPPVDMASDDIKKMKEQLQRGLEDEQIAQYVAKLETEIGTTINEAAFAQVTGASNDSRQQLSRSEKTGTPTQTSHQPRKAPHP